MRFHGTPGFNENTPRGAGPLALLLWLVFCLSPVQAAPFNVEKEVLADIRQPDFGLYSKDRRCSHPARYKIFLIDNYQHRFSIAPGLSTSHAEMLVRLLKSGRTDIEVEILNTTLARGLAVVIRKLSEGGCADAVISSIPGSNYTPGQIKSLLPGYPGLNPDTRLSHRKALADLLEQIAFKGFPSVTWIKGADINLIKLREDAMKFVFIRALARFKVRVILPYGNPDTRHRGETRSINLLSLAENAMVFTGLDQAGNRMPGYPYSPLSSGDETAEYRITACPHPSDPERTVIDINEDGFFDYALPKGADRPDRCRVIGTLSGTSVIPPNKVKELLPAKHPLIHIKNEVLPGLIFSGSIRQHRPE